MKRSFDDKKLPTADKLADKRAVTSINMKMGWRDPSISFLYSTLAERNTFPNRHSSKVEHGELSKTLSIPTKIREAPHSR